MNQEKKISNAGGNSGIIQKLFQHSAIYSISTSIQRLQGLLLTPIYTSTLYLSDMSQYSNYGLIYTFIAFMNFVYLYGMDSAFLRYFFLGKIDRKTVFTSIISLLIITGIIISLILFIFADPISKLILFSPQLSQLIRLAALILLLDTIGNFPFLILRAEERPYSFSLFRILRFTLELALVLVLVVFLKRGVLGILYANIIAASINLIVMFPFAWKYINFKIDIFLIQELIRFGLPFLPNGIAFMTIEMIDRFLVTKFLGKETLAFYHANYKFATIMLFIIIGFRNAWQPFFLKIAKQDFSKQTYSKILNYYFLIAGGMSVFLTFFIKDILVYKYFNYFYLLGQQYWPGIQIIPWIVLSYFLFGIYVIFTPAFYITKKSKYMVIFTGTGAIINILINLILLPKIGISGAVIATLGAYTAMTVLIFFVAHKIYPIPIDKIKLSWVLMLVGLAYLFYYILHPVLLIKIVAFLIFATLSFLKIQWVEPKSLET